MNLEGTEDGREFDEIFRISKILDFHLGRNLEIPANWNISARILFNIYNIRRDDLDQIEPFI